MTGTGSGRMTADARHGPGPGRNDGRQHDGRRNASLCGTHINGHLPEDPVMFNTRKGERLRLRLSMLPAHRPIESQLAAIMAITHTDSRPVRSHSPWTRFTSAWANGMTSLVEANNSGAWWIVAAALEENLPPARAILRYLDSPQATPAGVAAGRLQSGHILNISKLESLEPTSQPPQRIKTSTSFSPGGMMMSSAWTHGQAYQIPIPSRYEGSWIPVEMTNRSMMLHPMHLRSHFFRVANVLKDTLIIPPMMGRGTFKFLADNPGRWLLPLPQCLTHGIWNGA